VFEVGLFQPQHLPQGLELVWGGCGLRLRRARLATRLPPAATSRVRTPTGRPRTRPRSHPGPRLQSSPVTLPPASSSTAGPSEANQTELVEQGSQLLVRWPEGDRGFVLRSEGSPAMSSLPWPAPLGSEPGSLAPEWPDERPGRRRVPGQLAGPVAGHLAEQGPGDLFYPGRLRRAAGNHRAGAQAGCGGPSGRCDTHTG
jgi:hypothetical protein